MSKNKFIYKTLLPKKENYYYPLSNDNLSKEDLSAGIKVLRSGRITMGDKTRIFENNFAKIKCQICSNGQFWILCKFIGNFCIM